MAQVTTAFRRLLLKGIKWDSEKAGVTFADALKAACRARYSQNNTGQAILRAQGNGALVEFTLPQESSSFGPVAVAEAVSSLDDLFRACKADLVTGGNATPNSDQIFDEMMDRLTVVRSAYADRRLAILT